MCLQLAEKKESTLVVLGNFFVNPKFRLKINLRSIERTRKIIKKNFFKTDIEHLSQQLMAKLAVPPVESSTIFIDDPSTRHSVLGPRQIEVRCLYLDDIIGKRECLCG